MFTGNKTGQGPGKNCFTGALPPARLEKGERGGGKGAINIGSYSQWIPIVQRYAVLAAGCQGGPGWGVRDRGGPRREIGDQHKGKDILI